MNSIEAAQICQSAGIPWVPIADSNYILPDDMETLQDMICAAVNEAIDTIDKTTEEEMSKITGNINIPGLF